MKKNDRRSFIKKAGLGGIVLLAGGKAFAEQRTLEERLQPGFRKKYSANDKIRLAMIGCGIQGFANARSALKVPGVELAAACDLYDGRLIRMKEVFGDHLFTTKDYREIINRSDIDAICVSTSDHWHDHISNAALKSGKPVYCEKPMMHHIEEGHSMIAAEKASGLPVQVGSQRASAIETLKAKELFESGILGTLILADIRYDRSSANGAWQYSIPTDASTKTVDWGSFIGDAPKMPFDEKRFFWWRNYNDYGTGVAGDLFVHLFTALHVITSSLGPERIYASGGLRFWKDGRDAPDVTLGLFDYPATKNHPAFNVQMRVNFVDGSGGGSHVRLIGSEGVMTLNWNGITIQKNPVKTSPSYGGWDSFDTFSKKQQAEFEREFNEKFGKKKFEIQNPKELTYSVPSGYSAHVDHWANFIDAIRNGTKLVEDTTFGMRAAGPALATNLSMQSNKVINWDAVGMKVG